MSLLSSSSRHLLPRSLTSNTLVRSLSKPRRFCLSRPLRHSSVPAWPYLYRRDPSPTMAPQLDAYYKQVDSLSEHFIERLRAAVAIPSVSAEDNRRPDVVRVR